MAYRRTRGTTRSEESRSRPHRRHLFRSVLAALAVSGLVASIQASAPGAVGTPGVVLNEVSCSGTDWVELVNAGPSSISVANWLLTDDPVDAVRDGHGLRLPAGTVIPSGAFLLIQAGESGFAFDLVCGASTVRLADATGTLVDSFALPSLAKAATTLGRVPDGAGDWRVTVPTQGAANAVPVDSSVSDPAWLYDPLQVSQIDLASTPAALAQLSADPGTYVDARVTIHKGSTAYGPYAVGLKLKGHGTFRWLWGKSAFKVKFGYSVSGQKFGGLKGLTLNNMTQDPSMVAEAISSLFAAGIGSPTARVGYAYVRLNGAEYGLYANVETVDTVMAKRWFSTTQHIYEANYANDVGPGRAAQFDLQEGSDDRTDLEALGVADAGGATGWFERMQRVADMFELTRAWAVEHYIGQWDGYSYGALSTQPNNYYLQDDSGGRFSMMISGTDQTWIDRPSFGAYANGVMMRHCVSDQACRQLYVEQLRQIAASPLPPTLAGEARAILAVIAPWRAQDPRREQSVDHGLAQAEEKIASMQARPAELAAWLEHPTYWEVFPPSEDAPPDLADPRPAEETVVPTANLPAPSGVVAPPVSAARAKVTTRLGKPASVPARPVAGKRFTFSLPVSRSHTARLSCEPSVGGRRVPHTDSLTAGKVRLSLVVPRTSKGKTLRIRITISTVAGAVHHSYTYAIR